MIETHSNPRLNGNFAPLRSEDDFQLLVSGKMPSGLRGDLYRNGPNPQFEAWDNNYHWFGGDGMVHQFTISNGGVRYRNRYVRTNRWRLENAAGRGLFGGLGNPMSDPSVANVESEGVANTNVVHHAGRLMALEEGHAPIQMELDTLETMGPVDFGGRVTAHPKIDPVSNEMFFVNYSDHSMPLSAHVSWGSVDAAGNLTRRETFEAPYTSMIHDFLLTQNYLVIPLLPLTGSLDRAKRGLPPFAWEPSKPALLGVMRRDQGAPSLRWFEINSCYVFHVMNAYEVDNCLVADVMRYTQPPLFPDVDGVIAADEGAYLTRWNLDLSRSGNHVIETKLSTAAGEFPRIDERRSGLAYSHGWFAGQSKLPGGLLNDSLVHINLVSGNEERFMVPDGDGLSEAVFVPQSTGSSEGEGWLLSVRHRAKDDLSELLVLDALNVQAGPVATAQVTRRVPYGFHGNWVGARS